MTSHVEFATTDNAFYKLCEVPLPLTHAALLDVARKKFKNVTKQSRLFDGVNGQELRPDALEVKLAVGAKVMVSGKTGWRGAERLRAEYLSERSECVAEALPADAALVAADCKPNSASSSGTSPLRLQLVSFSYNLGQPGDTATNINARGLPNPGKAAVGRTGLDRRLAKEVLASPGAFELCEHVVQEALRQIQLHYNAASVDEVNASADEAVINGAAGTAGTPPLLRVGVGCDRGRHRSVAIAEAATARLVRKAEHARSGRNCPGLETLLRPVQLVEVDHRELAARHGGAEDAKADSDEQQQDVGDRPNVLDNWAELRILGGV